MHPACFFVFITKIFTMIGGHDALNLASGRQAWQSSAVFAGGVPSRAVDGNTNPFYEGNSCTHTEYQDNPWWVVDLGHIHAVTDVFVYNRRRASWRLQNFTAEVSMKDPRVHGLDIFQLCAYHPTQAGSKAKVMLRCVRPVIGRYLKIQVYLGVDVNAPYKLALTLCEVEVYSRNVNYRLFQTLNNTILTNAAKLRNINVMSLIQCVRYCQTDTLCTSFNIGYVDDKLDCELLDEINMSGKESADFNLNQCFYRQIPAGSREKMGHVYIYATNNYKRYKYFANVIGVYRGISEECGNRKTFAFRHFKTVNKHYHPIVKLLRR